MAEKRKFFTAEEKEHIKNFVFHYKDIVESKETDLISVAAKKRKWHEIAGEYNLCAQYTKVSCLY